MQENTIHYSHGPCRSVWCRPIPPGHIRFFFSARHVIMLLSSKALRLQKHLTGTKNFTNSTRNPLAKSSCLSRAARPTTAVSSAASTRAPRVKDQASARSTSGYDPTQLHTGKGVASGTCGWERSAAGAVHRRHQRGEARHDQWLKL